jgi:endonuclease I
MKKICFCIGLFFVFAIGLFAQIPIGYYSGTDYKIKAELKTALHQIIKIGHVENQYSQLWLHFGKTDRHLSGLVWDIYANCNYQFFVNQCGNYNAECQCYNREHVVPVSWIGGNIQPMYADLHHILPVDAWTNNIRANYPMSIVGAVSWTSTNGSKIGTSNIAGYGGIAFEPIDEYKGDIARIFMYMATRYEHLLHAWSQNSEYASVVYDGTTWPAFTEWASSLYLIWHETDPPSQKEINRNDSIFVIQKNRNPFIDYPEMARQIWGQDASTQNIEVDKNINMFPNPVENFVNIHSALPLKRICVYQFNGTKLYCEEVTGQEVKLHTAHLMSGFYFLECSDINNLSVWKKMIKK